MDPFFTEEQLNNMSRENMMEVMRIMQNQVRKKETEVQLLKDKQKELEFMNAMLSDRLALAQRRRFGSSSEKYADGYEQMDLFNEAEANADTDAAEIEEEISQLDDDEKAMFLEDLGLEESGLEKLIKASYHLLGLISYLTAGEPEVRAWTIKKGTKAPQAAGKIHTDFERGFIRAEVVSYDDLMACGTHAAAKEKGLVRLEGKDYVVQDGDIMLFRFNV